METTIEPRISQDLHTKPLVPRYQYEDLHDKGDWIRVLHLQSTRTRLEVSLEHIKHTDGNYQALSYVWGSHDTLYKAFVLDDSGATVGFIPLTENLHSALRNLRDCKDVIHKIFWIDQICINQESNEEKSHQVAMMGKIYTNALRVITYIGPADKDPALEEKGIHLIERLNQHFSPNYTCRGFGNPSNQFGFPVQELPPDLAAEDPDHFWGWKWIAKIVLGDWVTRLWMIQEQLLNPNIAILRGERLLRWDAVAAMSVLFILDLLPRAAFIIFWRENTRLNPELDADPWSFLYATTVSWKVHRVLTSSDQHTPYAGILESMHAFESLRCKDPRDRVYALLAISKDITELGIVPDYRLEKDEVFRNVSVRSLSFGGQINLKPLVSICNSDNSDPNCPSWAINLPRPREIRSSWLPMRGTVQAHPYSLTKVSFSPDNRIMFLSGRKIDDVEFSSPPRPTYPHLGRREYAACCLELLDRWTKVLLHEPVVTLGAVSALSRCLHAGQRWDPRSTELTDDQELVYELLVSYWAIYDKYVVPYLEDIQESTEVQMIRETKLMIQRLWCLSTDEKHTYTSSDTDVSAADLRGMFPERENAWTDADSFYNSTIHTGRSFGKTAQGRTFNAMNVVQEGDAIMVLEGSAHRLWVLRPAGKNTYRLIGDVWVDGCMEGQLYDGVNPDEVDYTIEIV